MDEYYSWKDLYYELHPHLKPDKTFSAKDIIRFFERNLTYIEQQEVIDYFQQFCTEDIEPETLPEVPPYPPTYLIPPIIPLIPSLPPALPPPPPSLPPPVPPALLPDFLSPIAPFIVIEALPDWALKILRDLLGVNEVEAAMIKLDKEWEKQYNTLEKKYVELSGSWMILHKKVAIYEKKLDELHSIKPISDESIREEYDELISEEDPFWDWEEDLEETTETGEESFTDSGFSLEDGVPEEIVDYWEILYRKIEREAASINLELEIRGWYISSEIAYHQISVWDPEYKEWDMYEFTTWELEQLVGKLYIYFQSYFVSFDDDFYEEEEEQEEEDDFWI